MSENVRGPITDQVLTYAFWNLKSVFHFLKLGKFRECTSDFQIVHFLLCSERCPNWTRPENIQTYYFVDWSIYSLGAKGRGQGIFVCTLVFPLPYWQLIDTQCSMVFPMFYVGDDWSHSVLLENHVIPPKKILVTIPKLLFEVIESRSLPNNQNFLFELTLHWAIYFFLSG